MEPSKRFDTRATRPIQRDSFIEEWPETGLRIFPGPGDPTPGIAVRDNRIVELDGKPEAQFDMIDRFIALRAIDPSVAEEAMAIPPLTIARMLVDINIPRAEIIRLFRGLSPARIVEIVALLNTIEMMMALQK